MQKYWNRQRIERGLIGLLLGGAMGLGFSTLFLWIINLIFNRIGRELIEITWKSIIPLAILMALSMAINMANPPFED